MTIPHLSTPSMLQSMISRAMIDNHIAIESWLRKQWQDKKPLITCSVDIRNASFKIAPVDTNVFPAGFNNLNPEFHPLCVQAMAATLTHAYPGCKRVGIIPESHTRNPFYLKSLMVLHEFLIQAGFEVQIGTLRDIDKPEHIALDGLKLTQWPTHQKDGRLYIGDNSPCIILLNHDLSGGVPEVLQAIEQPLIPPLSLGWQTRSKANHFKHYKNICEEFGPILGLDPWLLYPLHEICDEIDFSQKEVNSTLIEKSEQLLHQIQVKYDALGIDEKPYLVIKSDSGTYGMAVMTLTSIDALKSLNRKQRTKMTVSKGGTTVSKVIIQEGVPTMEQFGPDKASGEPVVYMIGEYVVGGFYRVHTQRGRFENLNAPGMHFEPLAFDTCCNTPNQRLNPHDHHNLFYAYSVIARLAHLAAVREQTL